MDYGVHVYSTAPGHVITGKTSACHSLIQGWCSLFAAFCCFKSYGKG